MTRGRENPACSITETGKPADSVRMLHSHHSLETFEWHAVAALATWGHDSRYSSVRSIAIHKPSTRN
jgi:hypothetical protein